MKAKNLLGVTVNSESKNTILEKIIKYISQPTGFFHIVSLNPENLVLTTENQEFKKVVETAQIKLIDGVGVALAGRLLGVPVGGRLTGVDMVKELLKLADRISSRVLLIGGKPNLALRLAQCWQLKYPQAKISGLEGFKNIKKPTEEEEEELFDIVSVRKPQIVMAAFGSPEQELWFWRNRRRLNGIVCLGVGGAFDYLSGAISRPPKIIQKIGLEWLYRLVRQPWRWRRQTRLIKFLWLLIKEKISRFN